MAASGHAAQQTLLSLTPTPDASRTARRALGDLDLPPEMAHTVTLLTSEIVGNCVRHAGMAPGDRILFSAQVGRDVTRIEVADTGVGFDPEVRHDAQGHGLRMLDKLASRWGNERSADGSRVWFEVDRRTGRFARATAA